MSNNKIISLGSKLVSLEQRLQYLEGQKETLTTQLEENSLRLKEITSEEDTFLKASSLLQSVSEKTRELSITKIEGIVTSALQEILDNPSIQFVILFENKRNAVSVEFKIRDNLIGTDMDVINGEAGGLKNVISTILRLVIIDLHSPKIEGPIILDEVGANISIEYQPRFGKFLKDYSRMMGRQIILVSHSTSVMIEADKEIRLSQTNGVSKVV
jgi:chromosome segregation ATPase